MNVQPGPNCPSRPPAGQSQSLGERRDGKEKEAHGKAASTPARLLTRLSHLCPLPTKGHKNSPLQKGKPQTQKGSPWSSKTRPFRAEGQQEERRMNFRVLRQTVPPKSLFKWESAIGHKSQFNSKNYFSWKWQALAPPYGHLPRELVTVCSPASQTLPCLPQLGQNLPATSASWLSRFSPSLVPSVVLASGSTISEPC